MNELTNKQLLAMRVEYREFIDYETGMRKRPRSESSALRNLKKRWRKFHKWKVESA